MRQLYPKNTRTAFGRRECQTGEPSTSPISPRHIATMTTPPHQTLQSSLEDSRNRYPSFLKTIGDSTPRIRVEARNARPKMDSGRLCGSRDMVRKADIAM